MEATITGYLMGEIAKLWQHNARYLETYTYDWWNHLDQPAPLRISSIRDALAACSWDCHQSVPRIQEGYAMSEGISEEMRGGDAISADVYASRHLKRAIKQCMSARLRLQGMIEDVAQQMYDIRERLGRAGVVVEDHRVVAIRARLIMMKGDRAAAI